MKKYKSADDFFENQEKWKPELERLREIMLSTGMEEALKWSIPNYLHGKKLVCGISGFKNHFGVWFHQGALLSDPKKVLETGKDSKAKAMRHWKMQHLRDIKVRILKSYLKEAMGLLDEGVEIKPQKKGEVVVPPELLSALQENHKAHQKFKELTPFKQREFADHVESAKREATKLRRIEKILPMIMDGVGLNDKYRNC